jgi:hypothetical protein
MGDRQAVSSLPSRTTIEIVRWRFHQGQCLVNNGVAILEAMFHSADPGGCGVLHDCVHCYLKKVGWQ